MVPKRPKTKADPRRVDQVLREVDLGEVIERGSRMIFELETFEEDFRSYLSSLEREFG